MRQFAPGLAPSYADQDPLRFNSRPRLVTQSLIGVHVVPSSVRDQVLSLLRRQAPVRCYPQPADLLRAVRTGEATMVLVSLVDGGGESLIKLIEEITSSVPHVPVIATTEFTPDAAGLLVRAGRAGLADVVLTGRADSSSRLTELVKCHIEPLHLRVSRALAASVPAHLQPALELCITRAADRPDVERLAHACGVHRRTLAASLQRCGLPSAGALISWGRLLRAAELLENPHRSIESAALSLNFPSASALHNLARRYAGATPREIRTGGGVAFVLAALARSIQRLRARTTATHRVTVPPTA